MTSKKTVIRFLSALGALVLLFALLTSCDGMTEKRVKGEDGVSVVASSAWQRMVGEESLSQLFDTEGADLSHIKLALSKKGGEEGYFVIEEVDLSAALKEIKDYVFSFANQPQKLDEIVQELQKQEFTEREIQLLKPLILGETLNDEALQYLEQELILQNYLYALKQEAQRAASLIGIEDMTIDGQRVQVAEYRYQNLDATEIRQYDIYMKKGDKFYLLSAWTASANFGRNSENYRALLRSALFG